MSDSEENSYNYVGILRMSIINAGLFSKALKEEDYRYCLNRLKAEIAALTGKNLAYQLTQKVYGMHVDADNPPARRESFQLEISKVISSIDTIVTDLDEKPSSFLKSKIAEARYQTLQKQTQTVIDCYNKLVTHPWMRHKISANCVVSAFENLFSRLADVLRSVLGMTKKGNLIHSDAQRTLAESFQPLLSEVARIQKDMKSKAVNPKKLTGRIQDPLYNGQNFNFEMPDYANPKNNGSELIYKGL